MHLAPETGCHEELIERLQSPLARSTDLTASLHFLLGMAWMRTKSFKLAAAEFKRCIEKRGRPALSPVNRNILKAGPNHCLALCLAQIQEFAAAESAFLAGLEEDPHSRPIRFDYAEFLARRARELEALQILHPLVSDAKTEPEVWHLGGEIALSIPDFIDFAADWTGEALKQHPRSSSIRRQRSEALLLSGHITAALPLWIECAEDKPDARGLAAVILCQLAEDLTTTPCQAADEPAVSREFIKWYRRLIDVNRHDLLGRLNQRRSHLAQALPTAAELLRTALQEAGTVA